MSQGPAGNATGVGIVLRSRNDAVHRTTGALAGQGPATVGLDLATYSPGKHLFSCWLAILAICSDSSLSSVSGAHRLCLSLA